MAPGMDANNPFLPVRLPEFGFDVGWAMCRNAMCPNFGVQFAGAAPAGARSISDDRYAIDAVRGRLRRRHCGHSFVLNSNAAIRRVARLFLSWSLPFADCPNPACANSGVNLFENHPPGVRPSRRPYRREGDDRARCGLCGSRFRVGSPLRLHVGRAGGRTEAAARSALRRVIDGAMDNRSVGRTMRKAGIGPDVYHSHLRAAGTRLRDYMAWRAAGLLRPRFARWEGPVRIHTDMMDVSMWRWGDARRRRSLLTPVSVVDLPGERTSYILAAHPAHLPMSRREFAAAMSEIAGSDPHTSAYASPWDSLEHPMRVNPRRSSERQFRGLPAIDGHGLHIVEQYAALAHFLTLRALLRRFPLVHHCMDGSRAQMGAALTALADEARTGRW